MNIAFEVFHGESFPWAQTHLEVLESKDVQDADGFEVFFAPDAVVELADDPVETLRIKCHGHGVSGVHRLQTSRGKRKTQTTDTSQNEPKTTVFSDRLYLFYTIILYHYISDKMFITENYKLILKIYSYSYKKSVC